MTTEEVTRTIQLILAPVVMVSACSIFVGGLLGHYAAVNDRLRGLTRERLDLLRRLRGTTAEAAQQAIDSERVAEIDEQLPDLLRRHRLVHHAVLAVYSAILILIATMVVIAITATLSASWVAVVVLAAFIAGVLAMLAGVLFTAVEIRVSQRAIAFEVERVTRLAERAR
jgi:hypothetical protein